MGSGKYKGKADIIEGLKQRPYKAVCYDFDDKVVVVFIFKAENLSVAWDITERVWASRFPGVPFNQPWHLDMKRMGSDMRKIYQEGTFWEKAIPEDDRVMYYREMEGPFNFGPQGKDYESYPGQLQQREGDRLMYFLFVYDQYYPTGPEGDCHSIHASLEGAIEEGRKHRGHDFVCVCTAAVGEGFTEVWDLDDES
jgi:hypothetical protein